jgi:hypothetical protein
MSFGQKVFDEMIWDQDMHVRKGTSVKYLNSFISIGEKIVWLLNGTAHFKKI